MKKQSKYLLFYLLIFINFLCSAQNVDSLLTILKLEKQDTNKLNILFQIVESIDDNAIWPKYNQQAHQLAEKLLKSNDEYILKKAKKALAEALSNEGIVFGYKGEINNALDSYTKSLKIRYEIADKRGIANSLNNIGGIYDMQGNIPKALENYHKSLKIQEEINSFQDQATTLNNLGVIYTRTNDFKNALFFYEKSMVLEKKLNNKRGLAHSISNIGYIYQSKGDTVKALEYYNISLKIQEEINDKSGIATTLNNIGDIFNDQGNTIKALEYTKKSLKLRVETGDKKGIIGSFNNLGVLYYLLALSEKSNNGKQKYLKLSITYIDSALALSKQSDYAENIKLSEKTYAIIDSARQNYKGAFEHYKEYIRYSDKINNEETRKASIKSQLNYEFEKKEAVLKEQRAKERAIANEQSRIQKIIIACVLIGFLLMVGFVFFVFRSLKITRNQKEIIEEKQKEILDSIRYAKRIQTSLMPSEKYIEKKLNC
ncbi:MAG: tetratricopeptide repeat protein [Bacteroidota bacterium]|nr:tetratricopeptide repeat protein [Bacteroidota bacterium]